MTALSGEFPVSFCEAGERRAKEETSVRSLQVKDLFAGKETITP